ncbi:hypothetical protein PO909_016591 [Leuciscus waleckii]
MSPSPRPFIASAFLLPGSSAGLDRHSRSAFGGRRLATATDFQDSGCTLTLHPFGTPGLLPSSDLPVGLHHHIVTPVIRPHVTASVPQISGSAPVFRVYGATMVRRPLSSAGSSATHGSAAVDRLLGVVLSVSSDTTLAPPPACATMVSMANVPMFQSNPSGSVLYELQLSYGLFGKASEESITIIHPAGDESMHKLL